MGATSNNAEPTQATELVNQETGETITPNPTVTEQTVETKSE